ncbi:MAG TPA: hypothetical protein EYN89_05945 [Flavobacteriales bacterium]|nr:hypothetical protein [Flavobacteriales bacterium]
MYKFPLIVSFLICALIVVAQGNAGVSGYKTYQEFMENSASETIDYRLEQRTSNHIFMTGGIANHKFNKVKPKSLKIKLARELWGVQQDGKDYINAYPYSERKGYNEILGTGPYKYFIGEPAYTKGPQIQLGFIEPGDPLRAVCCKTGYVLYPDGIVKLLSPDLLEQIVAENEALLERTKQARLKQDDILEMFKIIAELNKARN